MNILMVAAENDTLPGGKVGGIGDVVRDIPEALGRLYHQVNVVLPSYGCFSKLPEAHYETSVRVNFAHHIHNVDLYKINVENASGNVNQWVLDDPLFAIGGEGSIYCDDPDDRPFANDSTKFALFNLAVAEAIIQGAFGDVDVMHLHDWHAAILCVLRAYEPRYESLQSIKTVYSIHNLALQGIRPFAGDVSAFCTWFPHLSYDTEVINDPRYPHCFNPVKACINLSDKVHAVSPTYAQEILLPSDSENGYFGGEGLQVELQKANDEGKLYGILNGCEYPNEKVTKLTIPNLLMLLSEQTLKWIGKSPTVESAHQIAITRLTHLLSTKKLSSSSTIITSVGRITDQKVLLLKQQMPSGQSALEALLDVLDGDGIFILLGSGDAKLENFLTKVASVKENFIFLKGYSQTLSDALYHRGDLFMMPSSFEPCGISQMLAMRAKQPCLVHSVGGLKDTVENQVTGFSFAGDDLQEQAHNMIDCFASTMEIKKNNTKLYNQIKRNAGKSKFLWENIAKDYLAQLYQF